LIEPRGGWQLVASPALAVDTQSCRIVAKGAEERKTALLHVIIDDGRRAAR
jgi:hypothetical protein